ncbi:hypothetical protein Smp_180700 [Schistosoma mansoni]|uniref:hypothetical protein n=1 Tax=Schistosoma mansoni TaxID=6183 RepID=UPI00022C834C|nr:hypothetical protein Smp_180700 [Schistosoma mansoni]|eukprot:XP_018647239.1 hypothetical protein Smp_180700 [Schistosoma mansoni]
MLVFLESVIRTFGYEMDFDLWRTTSTMPNSNFDDLIEIKTNLWNVDRNVLIRLARVMGTLSQVNNLLISLDKNIKVWKETLRKTFSHLMNKLIHKYIFNYHNEIVPLNLLQEIYQSIKIHNQSGESSLKCFHSKVFTEHQPDNIIQELKNDPN